MLATGKLAAEVIIRDRLMQVRIFKTELVLLNATVIIKFTFLVVNLKVAFFSE